MVAARIVGVHNSTAAHRCCPQGDWTSAGWLRDRLARRRDTLIERFTALRENPKPFRRLAKRLGVYTTAIRLDRVNTSETFGELTARRLIDETQPLRAAVIGIRNGGDARALRRVDRSVAHLVHLLEPVRRATPSKDWLAWRTTFATTSRAFARLRSSGRP
jgi:hypothetical protein